MKKHPATKGKHHPIDPQRRAAGWPTSDRNPGRLRIGTGGRLQIGMHGRLRRNPHDEFSEPHSERRFIHFGVTWARDRRLYGMDVIAFFIRPKRLVSEMVGFDKEILLIHHPYSTLQARILHVASQILTEAPAQGRVEPLLFVLVSRTRDWLLDPTDRLAVRVARDGDPEPVACP